MATTTNFGWETPDDTDLVKDGAAAMRTLGNSIDTSFVDLKGGTSGQMLTKASATDLDYTWVTPQIGDITAITATSPLTGGGTTGDVTIGILSGTTSNLGAVQLSTSTSSTSTSLAATASAVKSAYDLADAAIAKSIVDAKGDIVAATGADTVSRLAVGTNNQVLTADSSTATGLKWATPSGGGGWTLINTGGTALSGSSTTIGSIPGTYKSLVVLIEDFYFTGTGGAYFCMRVNNDTTANLHQKISSVVATASASQAGQESNFVYLTQGTVKNTDQNNFCQITINNYASAINKNMDFTTTWLNSVDTRHTETGAISFRSTSAISSLVLFPDGGSFGGGTAYVYGVQ
jgi:hypothetical protein